MMCVPVTILRIITSFYIFGFPGIVPIVGVGNAYENHSSKVSSNYVQTSTALINRQTLAADQSTRHATGCDLLPNFRCASQDFCIPTKLVLNGYNDCPDGSDEDARKVDFCKLGAPFHRCDANSRCVTTSFGYRCQCLEGFAGDGFYCERFPVGIQIAAAIEDTLEDTSVPFNVSVVVFPYGRSSNLSLTITGLPKNAKFDIGSQCNQTAWCFTEDDFSYGTYISANFYPPGDFSGTIPLTIVAELYRDGYWVTGYSATNFEVTPVPDAPVLRVGTVCYMDEENVAVEIPIRAQLVDSDGSEELEIDLDGLPEGFEVSTSTDQIGREVAAGSGEPVVTSLIVKPHKEMVPFNATIIALAREKFNGKENRTTKTVLVAKCPPQPNMNVIFEVPSVNMEDQPIPFLIKVNYELEESPRLISIILLDLPPGASLSRGHAASNSTSWILSRQDLSNDGGLFFIPPKRFAGEITLNGRSEILYRGFHYMLNSTVAIQISPVVNAPHVSVMPEVICLSINATNASFVIDASLADSDGSETLMVQYSIPEEWVASTGDSFHGSYNLLTSEDHVFYNITIISPGGFLYPVEIPVVAVALEKDNADQNINFTKVRIVACDAAMYQALSRPRTTIIWNVTTPIPLAISPATADANLTTMASALLNVTFSNRNLVGSRDASETKTPPPRNAHKNLPKNVLKKGTDFPIPSASSQVVQTISGLSQADESPRFNRNFSYMTASTTKSPAKVQRLARPLSEPTTRRTNSKAKHRKTKPPATPGRAKFEDIELQQTLLVGNGSEDTPIIFNISVATKNAPKHSATETRIFGLPLGSWLTKGHPDNGSKAWILPHRDLGVLYINLPAHVSGNFPLIVSSSVGVHKNKTLIARESVDLKVMPQTDGGEIEISGPFSPKDCVQKSDKEIRLIIHVNLTDRDGSEEVEFLEVTGIPKSVIMSPGRLLGTEMAYILFPTELDRNITLRTETTFSKFKFSIDAKIREKETGIKNSVIKYVTLSPCVPGFHSDSETTKNAGSAQVLRMSLIYFMALSIAGLPLI